MAQDNTTAEIDATRHDQPIIHDIKTKDLIEVLKKGLADFNAMPTHLPFLCLIYPVVMFFGIRFYGDYDVLPLLFPLLAGYTLVGPLVALGMYELSKRRETGADISRWHAFEVIQSPQILSIAVLSAILMAFYGAWMFAAYAIFGEITGGVSPDSVDAFIQMVFNTSQGQRLILVGCSMGMVFSVIVLSISVISFPMLLDRKVAIITAIHTSVSVVFTNPVSMGKWGLIVVGGLLIGAIPLFIGLAVVLPILGHATWHLYRRTIEF